MEIRNSVVVVTGASSGIGRATALALAARGARPVLVSRDTAALAEVARACAALGADAVVEPADVSDADAVEAVARRTAERFGRIDGWVNAAAVMMFGALLDCPLADVRRVLDVNLMGYVHGCRAALPRMIEQRGGVVVNVSSILERSMELAEQRRERVRSRIDLMRGYAESTDCRRRLLLGYFGEDRDEPCGACDDCDAGTSVRHDPQAAARAAASGAAEQARVRHPEFGTAR